MAPERQPGGHPKGRSGRWCAPVPVKHSSMDIGSSILSLPTHVPVAQLDSAAPPEGAGHPFESDRGYHGAHLAGAGGGLQTPPSLGSIPRRVSTARGPEDKAAPS
jgi:hypothetical protein